MYLELYSGTTMDSQPQNVGVYNLSSGPKIGPLSWVTSVENQINFGLEGDASFPAFSVHSLIVVGTRPYYDGVLWNEWNVISQAEFDRLDERAKAQLELFEPAKAEFWARSDAERIWNDWGGNTPAKVLVVTDNARLADVQSVGEVEITTLDLNEMDDSVVWPTRMKQVTSPGFLNRVAELMAAN